MRTAPGALALTLVLAAAGCSESEPFEEDDRAADAVLEDAVAATLAVDSFTIDSLANLSVQNQDFTLEADGSVAYDTPVGDVTIAITQASAEGQLRVLADGEKMWVGLQGDNLPPVPEEKEWVEGEASLLQQAESFQPAGLAGVVIALRAAQDVEEGEIEERDGVAVRQYTTTVNYRDAVRAAGEDQQAFQSALSLTGEAEASVLEIEVWVGEDDVIRAFDLDIQSDAAVDGNYRVDISEVNEEVDAPDTPPAEDVLTGQQAEQFLSGLVQ